MDKSIFKKFGLASINIYTNLDIKKVRQKADKFLPDLRFFFQNVFKSRSIGFCPASNNAFKVLLLVKQFDCLSFHSSNASLIVL
jgi:hypothetical protein